VHDDLLGRKTNTYKFKCRLCITTRCLRDKQPFCIILPAGNTECRLAGVEIYMCQSYKFRIFYWLLNSAVFSDVEFRK